MTLAPVLNYLATFLALLAILSVIPALRLAFSALTRLSVAAVFALPQLKAPVAFPSPDAAIPELGTTNLYLFLLEKVAEGLLFAVFLAFLLECIPLAGKLIDLCRGAQYSEQVLPELGERSSPFETMGILLSGCLMFSPLGYEILFSHALNLMPRAWNTLENSLLSAYHLLQSSFSFALLIAAPVLLTSLLLDTGSALLSRYLNRTNMSFELLGSKMCLGIAIFALILPDLLKRWEMFFLEWSSELASLLLSSGA